MELDVRNICALLQRSRGVDFSGYKQSTIKRRIARRMQALSLAAPGAYAARLRADGQELQALYEDLLINVTQFFRDPHVFKALEARAYPKLLEKRTSGQPLRLWIAGCSTGEEAYSHAMCLMDYLADAGASRELQVFATDVSERSLAKARAGFYPSSIARDVPKDRLERYFTRAAGGYQVVKRVRDACIFARQDVTRDPPFSNLDLVVCRNVLIYLGRELQRRALSLFHYALKPGGFLILGGSEATGDFGDRFVALHKGAGIFTRAPGSSRAKLPPVLQPYAAASFVDSLSRGPAAATSDGAGQLREFLLEVRAALEKASRSGKPPLVEARRDGADGRGLRRELEILRGQLRSVSEAKDAANEELVSTNEELQSMNEELETAKEELQASNEEMATINDELRGRNADLKAANDDLTNLLANLNIPVVIVDNDLRVRKVTEPAERALNLVPADAGRRLADLRLPLEIPELDKAVRRVIEDVGSRQIETRDRAGRWHSAWIRAYRTSDNKIDGAVLAFVDVDEQKRALKALEEATQTRERAIAARLRTEERFHLFLEAVKDYAIFTLDANGTVMTWNVGAQRLKGYKAEEIVGRHYSMFFSPEDFRARLPWKLLRRAAQQGSSRDEGWRVRRDGTRFLADATLTAIRDKAGKLLGFVKVTRDVTERKKAEEAEILRKREQMQREFVANVSHELRTPLAAIKGFSETLLRGALDDAENRRSFVETIDKHAALLTHLVEELLELSALESGRKPARRRSIALLPAVRRVAESLAPKARKQRVHVELAVPARLTVVFDPTQLTQVLTNLVDNAIKYNRAGGHVQVRAVAAGREVLVSVRDTGGGISRSELERIFDRFHRGKEHRGRQIAGAGLGLAIVRTILRNHGCRIWAESLKGKGSAFHCTLPLRKPGR